MEQETCFLYGQCIHPTQVPLIHQNRKKTRWHTVSNSYSVMCFRISKSLLKIILRYNWHIKIFIAAYVEVRNTKLTDKGKRSRKGQLKRWILKRKKSILRRYKGMESSEKASSDGVGDPRVRPQTQVTTEEPRTG